jgi:hypothetical protein
MQSCVECHAGLSLLQTNYAFNLDSIQLMRNLTIKIALRKLSFMLEGKSAVSGLMHTQHVAV